MLSPARRRQLHRAVAEAIAVEFQDHIDAASNKLGYLYRVGQNAARRNGSRAQPGRSDAADEQRLPDVEPALLPALTKLSAQQRTAVLLVHGFGWSQTDAAELLDVNLDPIIMAPPSPHANSASPQPRPSTASL